MIIQADPVLLRSGARPSEAGRHRSGPGGRRHSGRVPFCPGAAPAGGTRGGSRRAKSATPDCKHVSRMSWRGVHRSLISRTRDASFLNMTRLARRWTEPVGERAGAPAEPRRPRTDSALNREVAISMISASPPPRAKRPRTRHGPCPFLARCSASAGARFPATGRFVRPRPPFPPGGIEPDPRRQLLAPSCPQQPVGALPLVTRASQNRRPISGNPPSLSFLHCDPFTCVSFLGCTMCGGEGARIAAGGCTACGGRVHGLRGVGVRTSPGPKRRERSSTRRDDCLWRAKPD
jgi:hypothetical protein